MKIIIAGYMVAYPFAGPTWQGLHFILGLRQLGHDVYFLEDSGDYSWVYNPETYNCGEYESPAYGLKYIQAIFHYFGLDGRWCYYSQFFNQYYGMSEKQLDALCQSADLFINVSGVNPLRDRYRQAQCTVIIDTDPGFNQIRMLQEPHFRQFYAEHDFRFTIAMNLGDADCPIPDVGLTWLKTPQPIFLDFWKFVPPAPSPCAYTTVMNWKSYRNVEFQGQIYGQKDVEFAVYENLPQQTNIELELAIANGAPKQLLESKGWRIVDANQVTKNLTAYQQYITLSRGELAIAKNGYVRGRCGWFSERSAQYLATGRPVITQDTNFSTWLPIGTGLQVFSNLEEAISALEAIENNYAQHYHTARLIAEEYFDSQKVLTRMLAQIK